MILLSDQYRYSVTSFFRVICILCILLVTINSFSQERIIKGQILDIDTEHPISNAHLTINNVQWLITDSIGCFEFVIDEFPIIIEARHLSYETKLVTISELPKSTFVILMKTNVNEVNEIQIFASKLRKLTKTLDISLKSFEFDNNNLWMIGYQNNRNSQCKLILASEFGDTIYSTPLFSTTGLDY